MRLKKKDRLYYARIIPKTGIYEVCEVLIRTVEDTWFVAIDKRDKHAYLFVYDDIGKILFYERNVALTKVIDAEKKAPKSGCEIFYEEY